MIEKSKIQIETDKSFPIYIEKRSSDQQPVIMSCHWHECIEIIFIKSGEVDIKINDETKTVKPGEFAFVNNTQVHMLYAAQKGTELYFIYIPFDFLRGSTPGVCDVSYLLPLYLKEVFIEPFVCDESLSGIINAITDEYEIKRQCYEWKIKGLVYILFSELLRSCRDKTERYKSKNMRLYDEIVKSVNYIDDHYAERDLVNRIHTIAGLEKSYFIKKFKAVLGMTPAAYINKIRLDKANELIYFSELTVTEIAEKAGFDTANYFTRKYKETYSKTPKFAQTLRQKKADSQSEPV